MSYFKSYSAFAKFEPLNFDFFPTNLLSIYFFVIILDHFFLFDHFFVNFLEKEFESSSNFYHSTYFLDQSSNGISQFL
jgi:hypothetical protein